MKTGTVGASGAAPLLNACTLVALLCVAAPAVAAPGAVAVPGHDRPQRPSQVRRGPGKSPVTLNLDNAPIQAVLHMLFRKANQSYVLGPRVTGTVTASLQNIPFDAGLRQILSANSVPLTEKSVNGVYVINGPRITRGARPATTRRGRRYRAAAPVRRPNLYAGSPDVRPYAVPGTAGGVRVVP